VTVSEESSVHSRKAMMMLLLLLLLLLLSLLFASLLERGVSARYFSLPL
jgi:hypothetical protein